MLNGGYTYKATIEGSVTGEPNTVTKGESAITSFKLYEPSGTLVYDSDNPDDSKYSFAFITGKIRVTPPIITLISIKVEGDYEKNSNGEDKEYKQTLFRVDSSAIAGATVELNGFETVMSTPGKFDMESWSKQGKTSMIKVTKDGVTLTENVDYYLVVSNPIIVKKRLLTNVRTASIEKTYVEGMDPVKAEQINASNLPDGCIITATFTSEGRTLPGEEPNQISDLKIIHEATGEDVTKYCEYEEIKIGIIRVVSKS